MSETDTTTVPTDVIENDKPPRLSIFDICETDTTAEEEGRWFNDIFDDETGIDVKLRRLTSKKSLAVRRRLEKQYRSKAVKGKFPEEVAIQITVEQVAEAVIVGWKGIVDRDGSVIPFSKENALRLMQALPAFRDLIIMKANALDNFRIEDRAEAEKN